MRSLHSQQTANATKSKQSVMSIFISVFAFRSLTTDRYIFMTDIYFQTSSSRCVQYEVKAACIEPRVYVRVTVVPRHPHPGVTQAIKPRGKVGFTVQNTRDMFVEDLGKIKLSESGRWTCERQLLLAISEACKAILWPTSGVENLC